MTSSQQKDFVRGADTLAHEVVMLSYTAILSGIAWIISSLILALFLTFLVIPEKQTVYTSTYIKSSISDLLPIRKSPQTTISINNKEYIVPTTQILNDKDFKKNTFYTVKLFLVILIFSLLFTSKYLIRYVNKMKERGKEIKDDTYLRGALLTDTTSLNKMTQTDSVSSNSLSLAGVNLIKGSENRHILISGTTGAGKSQAIFELLDYIRLNGDAAIIYDKAGEFIERYYEESDTILCPLDSRSPHWSPWQEIDSPPEVESFTKSFIPDSDKENDKFFSIAARTVLGVAIEKLENQDLSELKKLFLQSSIEELSDFFEGTEASSYINKDSEKTTASILATLMNHFKYFKYLEDDKEKEYFSVKNWVKNVDSNGNKPWLFLPSIEKYHEVIKPFITSWLDSAISTTLSLNKDSKRRIWLICDELPSLNKIPSLEKGLAEGRKFGLCGVLGVQSIPQLRTIYGKDNSLVLIDLCNTQLFLRANDPDTQEWASKSLGEQEIEEFRESLGYGVADNKEEKNLHYNRKNRRIVMPSEIKNLDDLHGFISLPGRWPVSEIKLEYKEKPIIANHFIERPYKKLYQTERNKTFNQVNDSNSFIGFS